MALRKLHVYSVVYKKRQVQQRDCRFLASDELGGINIWKSTDGGNHWAKRTKPGFIEHNDFYKFLEK